jgi:hypothetical protein
MKKISFVPGSIPGDLNVEMTLNLAANQSVEAQVKTFILANYGLLSKKDFIFALPGQAHAMAVLCAGREMFSGLFDSAQGFVPVIGVQSLDLSYFRHQLASHRRDEIEGDPTGTTPIFLNLGHEMNQGQIDAMAAKAGIEGVFEAHEFFGGSYRLPVEGGPEDILDTLIAGLKTAGLTTGDLATRRVIFQPQGNGWTGGLQLHALYGLAGNWPDMIRQAGPLGSMTTVEVISLKAVREWGSQQRPATTAMVPLDLLQRAVAGEVVDFSAFV